MQYSSIVLSDETIKMIDRDKAAQKNLGGQLLRHAMDSIRVDYEGKYKVTVTIVKYDDLKDNNASKS